MISTQDLQDWLRAEDADVPTLRQLEESAIKAIENLTGRYYGVEAAITEDLRFRSFPVSLKGEPIDGVITSLEQWDGSAWSLVPASNYYVAGSLIWSNPGFAWLFSPSMVLHPFAFPPSTLRLRVIYQAGYTVNSEDPDVWDAPVDIQQAVKMLVGHWFENRESVVVGTSGFEVPQSVQMLIASNTRVFV